MVMHRNASRPSSPGQAPGSPAVSTSLQQILKTSFYDPPYCRSEDSGNFPVAVWSLKHFQWILMVYATCVLIATSYASRAVYDLGESFKDIIELLQLDSSSSRLIDQTVSVSLLVSWLLAGGTIFASVISIVWKLWNAAKRERFKHLAKEGEINSRTTGMCMRFNALSLLLNTVHVFCILTCIWFVLMMCGLVALLVLLILGSESADGALDFVQEAERDANTFTADIFVRIEEYEKTLTSTAKTIDDYCLPLNGLCPEVILTTQDSIVELTKEMRTLLAAVEESESCPSASCINLELFWFLDATGCVCASETIQEFRKLGSTARSHCRSATIAILVAFISALLMLSKTAMNVKSHVKDDAWMRRVRRIFMKLQERGVRLPSNEPDDGLFDDESDSMALINDVYNAALPRLPAIGNTAKSTGGSQPQTPTRCASAQVSSPSKFLRGIGNRNLGIEPPVSLSGSDAGGSGVLPLPPSRLSLTATADGSGGASGSGLEVSTGGSVGPFGTYLPKSGSGSSGASGNGTPVHSARTNVSRRRLRQTDVTARSRVKRGRWGFSPGKQGSENKSSDGDENQNSSNVSKAWRLGTMQSMLSCIDASAGAVSRPKLQQIDGASRAQAGDRNNTSAPYMLTYGDVASGGVHTPADNMHEEEFEEAMLQAIEPAVPLSPDLTCKAPSLHGSVLGGLGAADSKTECPSSGLQLRSVASFETPPPFGPVELSVIHEVAPETSMTVPSTHESALETPEMAHNLPEASSSVPGSSGSPHGLGHSETAPSSVAPQARQGQLEKTLTLASSEPVASTPEPIP